MNKTYILMQMPSAIQHEKGWFGMQEHEKKTIDLKEYCWMHRGQVEGKTSGEMLESLYVKFNADRPYEFCGRSMSVGDIVMLGDGERLENREYWYCDTFGWQKVKNAKM